MKIEQVKKMKPLERFIYFIQERHAIYKRRKAGRKPPWTDDVVMQRTFFTNPYRENDKTTVWFRENIRDPLRNDCRVFFATVCFRWFNRIETGQLLMGKEVPGYMSKGKDLLLDWDEEIAVNRLKWLNKKQPVFTGAFMIKAGNGPPGCKIPLVCSSLTDVWNRRKEFTNYHIIWNLKDMWESLKQFRGLGGFMAYEIVTDLRHTYLLENATDIDTWANPGPGAMRELAVLEGLDWRAKVKNPIPKMRELLKIMRKELRDMPHFELREVEHSLCEAFKMEKALFGHAKIKRKYNGQ